MKLAFINQSNLAQQMNHWAELRDIPNQRNFQCIVQLQDGRQVLATVFRNDGGFHYLDITKEGGIDYATITAWRNITGQDREAIKAMEKP